MTTIEMPDDYMLEASSPSATKPKRGAVNPQLLARLTGALFIVTYLTSIPPVLSMYVPALSDPAYILGTSADPGLSWGAVLEILLIFANVATAVALFPVLKRQNEPLALGFVTARIIESVFIAIGIIAVLAIGTLRLEASTMDPGAMTAIGQALVAVHDWTFRIGPGVVVGLGNGLILGWLMWRTRLVPRALSILGLVGGVALLCSGLSIVAGTMEAGSLIANISVAPEFFWELGLGLWLMVMGFNKKALADLESRSQA